MYYILPEHLSKLELIRDQLYKEDHIDGDQQRDWAELLRIIIDDCKQMKLKED